jgi:hypothetical protein
MSKLTPNEYMDLLVRRRDEHERQHPPVSSWIRALPDWFIRDGDEDIVDMEAIERANRAVDAVERPKKPRRYKTAAELRERRERLQGQLDRLSGVRRHDTDDPAAYGGIGIRQTVRQRAKYAARLDRSITEAVRLQEQIKGLDARIIRADAREAKA